jgi:hypothetical protein
MKFPEVGCISRDERFFENSKDYARIGRLVTIVLKKNISAERSLSVLKGEMLRHVFSV